MSRPSPATQILPEPATYGAGPVTPAIDIYVEPFPPTGSRRKISQEGGYFPLWSRAGDRLFYRPRATTVGVTLKSVDIVTQPAFAFSNEQTLPIEDLSSGPELTGLGSWKNVRRRNLAVRRGGGYIRVLI